VLIFLIGTDAYSTFSSNSVFFFRWDSYFETGYYFLTATSTEPILSLFILSLVGIPSADCKLFNLATGVMGASRFFRVTYDLFCCEEE